MGGRRRIWLACVLGLCLTACTPFRPVWLSGAASTFYPEEPHHTLARAIRDGGDAKQLRALIPPGTDLNLVSRPGRVTWSIRPSAYSLLLWSMMADNTDAVQVLLERGADPNLRTAPDEPTPLHWAVLRQDERLMQLLVQHGADVNATAAISILQGQSPVMVLFDESEILTRELRGSVEQLTRAQRLARADRLLQAGAELNRLVVNEPQRTFTVRPVHSLALVGKWFGVLWFLQRGAELKAREPEGRLMACTVRSNYKLSAESYDRALKAAQQAGRPAPQRPSGNPDLDAVVDWLLAHGFTPDDFDRVKYPDTHGCQSYSLDTKR